MVVGTWHYLPQFFIQRKKAADAVFVLCFKSEASGHCDKSSKPAPSGVGELNDWSSTRCAVHSTVSNWCMMLLMVLMMLMQTLPPIAALTLNSQKLQQQQQQQPHCAQLNAQRPVPLLLVIIKEQ